MSYYISTSTAEMAYYNDLTAEAKDLIHYRISGKHYDELSQDIKDTFSKLSMNVKKYIETEDEDEQEKLWQSYDKFSQYLCDQDKYYKIYTT